MKRLSSSPLTVALLELEMDELDNMMSDETLCRASAAVGLGAARPHIGLGLRNSIGKHPKRG